MAKDAAYWREYRRRNGKRLNSQRRQRRAMERARSDLIGLPREQAKASAEAVAKWAAETLRMPTPPKAGQPFLLDPWQVAFFADALADDVREAGLAVARRNGKTFLIAVLCLAYLCGPLNRRCWRGAPCAGRPSCWPAGGAANARPAGRWKCITRWRWRTAARRMTSATSPCCAFHATKKKRAAIRRRVSFWWHGRRRALRRPLFLSEQDAWTGERGGWRRPAQLVAAPIGARNSPPAAAPALTEG